jgi:hypothetical protein
VLSGADLGGTPNGIALSPDGKWMYLSTANRQMRRYAVNPDGSLGAFTVFTEGVGIGDGEKTDTAGNMFSTGGAGPGIIRITSPAGKLLGTINLPSTAGAQETDLCDERRIRRFRWQNPLHGGMRFRLHDPVENAWDRAGAQREQVAATIGYSSFYWLVSCGPTFPGRHDTGIGRGPVQTAVDGLENASVYAAGINDRCVRGINGYRIQTT